MEELVLETPVLVLNYDTQNRSKMYNPTKPRKTSIVINESYEGERLETKIERIVNNKEPITDGAPIIFTERKDGVQPQYDVRTDRWEIAVEAMDVVSKTHQAKREERHMKKDENEGKIIDLKQGEKGDSQAESI